MSTYVLMKLLESTPQRYDRGIRLLSGGTIGAVYEAIARRAGAGRVLDLGCGTGGVALACAARGATVTGVDRDAGMLAVARAKVADAGLAEHVELVELGVLELEDAFAEASFDAIVSCLLLSELLPEERRYVLATARTRLRPRGRLVVADEVRPHDALPRLWQAMRRAPQAVLTRLLTQTSTHPVDDLADLVRAAGFVDVTESRVGRDMALVEARRADEEGA